MRPFLLSPMNSGIDVFQEYFALRRTIRYLLILSAVDFFNLIYSLACVNMSKIAVEVKS